MAGNALYPKWKQSIIQGTAGNSLTGNLKVALVDTGTYTYSNTHQFFSSITGVAGTPVALGNKSYVDGVLKADNVTFGSVPGGNNCEALVLYIDDGVAASSSPLVAYIDSGFISGMPVTPNGGDITVTWNASGIFAL